MVVGPTFRQKTKTKVFFTRPTYLEVLLSMMLILQTQVAAAMLHSISSKCQRETLMEKQLQAKVETTTAMLTWLVEAGAQNSISWRPTPMPGTLLFINVMRQVIRDIITTATEEVTATQLLMAKSRMVLEASSQSTLLNHSISKPHGAQMVHSASTLHKVHILKQ